MDYTEWPLDDLLLCSERIGITVYHQLYSYELDALAIISDEDAQGSVDRGIKQVDELPE